MRDLANVITIRIVELGHVWKFKLYFFGLTETDLLPNLAVSKHWHNVEKFKIFQTFFVCFVIIVRSTKFT